MDVAGNLDNENQNIQIYNKHGRVNQQWEVIYADQYPEEPVKGELNSDFGLYVERDFYVVSELNEHRYLDLINNRNLVIKTPNGRNTQRWYFDQKSLTIKTRLNNQSWDVKSSGRTSNMQVWSTNSQWFQIFRYEANHFCTIDRRGGKCLEVQYGKDAEGQAVMHLSRNDKKQQRWNVVYVD
jgi:hypothetical protein